MFEEGAIVRGNVGRSGTVDKNGVENIEFEDAPHHVVDAAFLFACIQCSAVVGGIDTCDVVNGFAAAADAD